VTSQLYDAVLFDLDGTLLGLDIDQFLGEYLAALVPWIEDKVPPRKFTSQLMASTRVMVENTDPAKTNREVFLADFLAALPELDDGQLPALLDHFYEEEFPRLRKHARRLPAAREAVRLARERGAKVVLATNPLFPLRAIQHRMEWAGLQAEWFDLITAYETSHFCKPQLDYYREIIQLVEADPETALMVGNDRDEDMVACRLGMDTYLVSGYLRGQGRSLPAPTYQGTLDELVSALRDGLLGPGRTREYTV